MGSVLSKGNDNLNNNNANDRHHDIFMDCNSDIMASPSSTVIANHIRQPSIRSRNLQPMPHTSELDRRFAKVLVSWTLIAMLLFFFDMWMKPLFEPKSQLRLVYAVNFTDERSRDKLSLLLNIYHSLYSRSQHKYGNVKFMIEFVGSCCFSSLLLDFERKWFQSQLYDVA